MVAVGWINPAPLQPLPSGDWAYMSPVPLIKMSFAICTMQSAPLADLLMAPLIVRLEFGM